MKSITFKKFCSFFSTQSFDFEKSGESGFKIDFSKERLKEKVYSNYSKYSRGSGISSLILLLMLFLFSNFLIAQTVSNNSQWGKNGSASSPASPVNWANGNAQQTNSHYAEGQSIATRIEVTGLTVGVEATLTFHLNIVQGSNNPPLHAFDFFTGPDRVAELIQLVENCSLFLYLATQYQWIQTDMPPADRGPKQQ